MLVSRQLLTEEELSEVKEACNMAIELNANKLKIYEFVESRMTFIAPNLSKIIGASTAAKLMGNFNLILRIQLGFPTLFDCNLLILQELLEDSPIFLRCLHVIFYYSGRRRKYFQDFLRSQLYLILGSFIIPTLYKICLL